MNCARLLPLALAAALPLAAQSPTPELLASLQSDFARLEPQTVRPAEGFILHPYLIPAGYYNQMWDWDGFFIGLHWASKDQPHPELLRDWVLSFAVAADADGYVAGCITPKGPRPLFGKFAMKPFLAQGALAASDALGSVEWLRPAWPALERIAQYRRQTQFDPQWGLWYWDNAMQSGADNNAALTNDPHDRSAILAVDATAFAWRELDSMAELARRLRMPAAARRYEAEARATRKALLAKLWSPKDGLFFNRRRDTGAWVRIQSWSSWVPLAFGLLPQAEGRRAIRQHLLNPAEMRSEFGFRSLSKADPVYNNQPTINPYSNWQGPIWINANLLDWMALRHYGFRHESAWLARTLATILFQDIEKNGSMHEDYSAETGQGLAPTLQDSPGGHFAGFVGWNLLAEQMLVCEVTGRHCLRFDRMQVHRADLQ